MRQFLTSLSTNLWQTAHAETKGILGYICTGVRFIVLLIQGTKDNRIINQAASLSYSTLMALGPLVAVIVMVSSFILKDQGEAFVAETLEKLVHFIAPSVLNYGPEITSTEAALAGLNPQILSFFEHIAQSARSGTIGLVGTFALLSIALLLIVSIEETLNTIWGIKQGRRWSERIVLYWTLLSLGALMSLAAGALLSLNAIAKICEDFPGGVELINNKRIILTTLSYGLITLFLTGFYRLMPNTTVKWKAAFAGGVMVTLCLIINNRLSFLYISKAVQSESLYGSIGIIPVLMLGLFIFWLFVLLGGQISYVVQNYRYLAHSRMWKAVRHRTEEALALAAFLTIARRFAQGKTPCTLEALSHHLKTPAQTLNNALQVLIEQGWISGTHGIENTNDAPLSYTPSYPLERLCLLDFRHAFEGGEGNEAERLLEAAEPLLIDYRNALRANEGNSILTVDLYTLLKEANS